MNKLKNASFLLSTYAPMGFVSYADTVTNLDNIHNFLIKGAPGCGKSDMLTKIAETLNKNGHCVEFIHSQNFPDSLEAVICKNCNVAFFDANIIEPIYPIIKDEIISIYDCVDQKLLVDSSNKLISLFDSYSSINTRIIRYITALGSLYSDNIRTASKSIDCEKINKFTNNLLKKFKSNKGIGNEETRLLSAITPKGIMFFSDTVELLASDITVLHDEHGSASNYILHKLRNNFIEKGINIITCYCSLAPYDKIEHIILPDLKMAFATSNSSHHLNFHSQKNIRCDSRFYNQDSIKLHAHRFSFNQKTSLELLNQIFSLQNESNDIYSEIEEIYKNACDFEKAEKRLLKYLNNL